jgi:DNA-binding NarL/FixJ family response regulator
MSINNCDEPTMKTLPDLTTSELEMLQLVLAGYIKQAIAAEIYISEKTVKFYLDNINANVDVRARIWAAAWALWRTRPSYPFK